MQVAKIRLPANGLVPAGAYFARLARDLADANAREEDRREALDLEEARLGARYRRASAARRSMPQPIDAAATRMPVRAQPPALDDAQRFAPWRPARIARR